jgi:predicted enzyme related to lactoylglutathione lyase
MIMTKKVTGLGGIFFKSSDPQKLKEWYRDNLGFKTTEWGAPFVWGDIDKSRKTLSRTEWSPFKDDTTYFKPSDHPYMINYRVDNLERLLEELRSGNVEIAGEMESTEYGKFGWIMDPERRKIELWEPPDENLGDPPPLLRDKVTGIGGIFFKSDDPKALTEWYVRHLDVGMSSFRWYDLAIENAAVPAHTIWAPFKNNSDYFSPSEKSFMFNYRVKDLSALISELESRGIELTGPLQEYSYGMFAWVMDPEKNKIELWEPKDDGFGDGG